MSDADLVRLPDLGVGVVGVGVSEVVGAVQKVVPRPAGGTGRGGGGGGKSEGRTCTLDAALAHQLFAACFWFQSGVGMMMGLEYIALA